MKKIENLAGKRCCCLREQNTGKKFTRHNKSTSKIYHVYYGIKRRCYNPKNSVYRYYGGKGVTMCDEWKNDFMAFYNWALVRLPSLSDFLIAASWKDVTIILCIN